MARWSWRRKTGSPRWPHRPSGTEVQRRVLTEARKRGREGVREQARQLSATAWRPRWLTALTTPEGVPRGQNCGPAARHPRIGRTAVLLETTRPCEVGRSRDQHTLRPQFGRRASSWACPPCRSARTQPMSVYPRWGVCATSRHWRSRPARQCCHASSVLCRLCAGRLGWGSLAGTFWGDGHGGPC